MATYWNRKCSSCGYKVSARTTSYNGMTVGAPLTKCPKCGHVQKISSHQEWIQMSSFSKVFCALNESFAYLMIILVGGIVGVIIPGILEAPVFVRVIGFVCGLVLGFFASYFIAVRSNAFLMAYAYSLFRTDDEEYRKMLGLPEPTEQLTAIPFHSLSQAQATKVAEIRNREHKTSEYYSPFNEL